MNNKLIAGLGVLTLTACQQNTDDIIIEDFESGTYANWTVEGDAFGATPATGSYTGQQPVTELMPPIDNGGQRRPDGALGSAATHRPWRILLLLVCWALPGLISVSQYI